MCLLTCFVYPHRVVSLGKYGSFPANQIIGRPYYVTFEILDSPNEDDGYVLRIVSAAELHAEALISEGSRDADGDGDGDESDGNGEYDENYDDDDNDNDVDGEGTTDGRRSLRMRTNRQIVDDGSAQKLTLEEIEALKKEATDAGREIIARLLESHSMLDQKSAFSLAKYTLRKRKKYLKRFTVVPVDVNLLTHFMIEEKDASRIMELRDELIGLIGCWGNVHHGGNLGAESAGSTKPNGRYLVVDETGGLLVAAVAERMGILHRSDDHQANQENGLLGGGEPPESGFERASAVGYDEAGPDGQDELLSSEQKSQIPLPKKIPTQSRAAASELGSAQGTSITLLHAHSQPNLFLLKYFGYDPDETNDVHPLQKHLKTVSWLQLVDPESDSVYANEPPVIDTETLSGFKPTKRSAYYRKRNRWARTRSIVDETRAGDFDGLVIASLMEPASILKHTVPLLAGSASVVVYSPTIEPLCELIDLYSTPRRTAYINRKREIEERHSERREDDRAEVAAKLSQLESEFTLDPTLLLAPSLQTSRVRSWQVLPGRTHPVMSARGGAEGYVFHAVKVLPSQHQVQAFGNPGRKRRKVLPSTQDTASPPTHMAPSADAS